MTVYVILPFFALTVYKCSLFLKSGVCVCVCVFTVLTGQGYKLERYVTVL